MMKHRNEDELAKLAFGDLSGPEAERARAIADSDPRAAAVLSSYREMADGLRRLPVPEHQLSTERLRNVILDQNLKRRPSPFAIWRWLAAPLAVGTAAYLFTIGLHNANQGTVATIVDDQPAPDLALKAKPLDIKPPTNAAVAVPSNAETRVAAAPPVKRSVRVAMNNPSHDEPLKSIAKMRAGGEGLGDRFKTMRSNPEELVAANIESAVMNTALTADASPSLGMPIVIIGGETDLNTGASSAKEVSTANNVIVGG